MADPLLDAIEIETAAAPDAAVIWMHGLGDDGKGWSDIVRSLPLKENAAIRFIFPHAPVMPVTINNGMSMRAWYDIRAANLNERADLAGVRRSQAQVEALVAREKSRGIVARRMLIAGFSQGGAIALYAGLRHAERLAGVIALSTYLIDGAGLATEGAAANRDVPVFMAHGLYDPVVQLAWAQGSQAALVTQHYAVEWHTYPMQHSASLEEVADIGKFLERVLA
ncbi:MAG: alpha/beta hydrolase-fold protein [Casimicrobiaceae bacterium]